MDINVTYDASVEAAPAGFTTVVADVVSYFDAVFTNPITVNIDVGWGEIDGQSLRSGLLGESLTEGAGDATYDEVKGALAANATTADARAALASLPADNPTGSAGFGLSRSLAKALGLLGPSSAPDGYVGFNSAPGTFNFGDVNNFTGPTVPGEYDLFGIVAHEFSEVMGRRMEVGVGGAYDLLDLFDYTAPGMRGLSPSSVGRYFSIDGGKTNLDLFNTASGGDLFDWADSAGSDSFRAFSNPGVLNTVTTADLTLMNAIGYDLAPDFVASLSFLKGDTLSFQISNAWQAAGPSSTTGLYLSSNSTVTQADTLLGAVATPAITASGVVDQNAGLPLPYSLAGGLYYVAVVADYAGATADTNPLNNVSDSQPILVLDDANLGMIARYPSTPAFDLGGLDITGPFEAPVSFFVNAGLGGGGTLSVDAGTLAFGADAAVTIPRITMADGAEVEVQHYLIYAGLWSLGAGSGSLTIDSGGVLALTGAGDILAAPVTGQGTLMLSGANTTFASGSDPTVAEIAVSGSGASVIVQQTLTYLGLWKQISGTLSIATGQRLSFGGADDRFAGTLTGGGTLSFIGGVASLAAGAVVTAANVTVAGGRLVIDGPASFAGRWVQTGGTLWIAAGASLSLTGAANMLAGAIVGAGRLVVAGGVDSLSAGTTANVDEIGVTGGELVIHGGLDYAGRWVQAGGRLWIGAGADLTLSGSANSFAGAIAGAGQLTLAGGAAQLNALAAFTVASVAVDGAATRVTVGAALSYAGAWLQSAGILDVAAGDGLTFRGKGDRFTGTLTGAGTVAFYGGVQSLTDTTLGLGRISITNASMTLAGSITNQTTIAASTGSLVIAASGASLSGGGRLTLSDLVSNRLYGATGAATLTNVDNIISGAGQIGAGRMLLINQAAGMIIGNQSTALTIDTGSATIVNLGVIAAAGKGGTIVKSAIDNTGLLEASGATLTLDGSVTGAGRVLVLGGSVIAADDFAETIAFGGAGGLVALARSQSYTGEISGFSRSGATSIDLRDIRFVGAGEATYSGGASGGVLTVSDGSHTAHISLAGNYTMSTFTAFDDGHGGTIISDPASEPMGPLNAFAAAMAAMPPKRAVSAAPAPSRGQTALATLVAPRS